jgi:hypothetical protein
MITRHATGAHAPVTQFTTEDHSGGDLIASYSHSTLAAYRTLPGIDLSAVVQFGSLRVIQRADHTSNQVEDVVSYFSSFSTRLLNAPAPGRVTVEIDAGNSTGTH